MNIPSKVHDHDTLAVKVGGRCEVRLPAETMRTLRIRKGTTLDVHVSGDVVMLVPRRRVEGRTDVIAEAWEQLEAEADQDIAAGRVRQFSDVEELIRDLREV
jgi:antitoxin component of MazEF toxin-antitoxin module